MKKDAVFDLDMTNRLVPFLVEECTKRPRASLWKTMKASRRTGLGRPRHGRAGAERKPSLHVPCHAKVSKRAATRV
jgi:hypothetical protein